MKEKLNENAQAVLEVVRMAHNHPTALEVYDVVKHKRPRIGLASVYRILRQLVERGYINELGRSDEGSRYDAQTARHDHAVCTVCGTLLDVPVEIVLPDEILQTAAQSAGITLTSHEIRLYGRCPSCLANTR